ncbi:MAG: nucleotidyltransferase [Planctomycetota bacterium]
MEKTLKVIRGIKLAGVIKDYAIGGGIGTMFYTESFYTKDLDIFVYPKLISGLVRLDEIHHYLKSKGYRWKGPYVIIEGVPVDFIPVYDELTQEALKKSVIRSFGNIKVKVFSPEYLIAIAIKTGREQDLLKVNRIIKETTVNRKLLSSILKKHHLKYDLK